MSNYLYGGYRFKDELVKYFRLQNLEAPLEGETQQMFLSLLNGVNKGYAFGTNSFYGSEPTFSLNSVIYNPATDLFISTNLLQYNPINSTFEFNKVLDLKNISRISNSLDPVLPQDLVTKSFLQNSIGGFGNGSVTSVGLTTLTNALSISGSPITTNGTLNINLSSRLQNFSDVGMGTNGQVLSTGLGNSYTWADPATVKSINVLGSTGITTTGGPITSTGTINLTLASNLQAISNLVADGIMYKAGSAITTSAIPIINGQIPISNNGSITWVTPVSGGNVTGTSITTPNALVVWGNSIGTRFYEGNIKR